MPKKKMFIFYIHMQTGNSIGDEGLEVLSKALIINTSLTELYLDGKSKGEKNAFIVCQFNTPK